MKEIDIQKQNIQKLIRLATEYPELPIITFVEGEIVYGDTDNAYISKIGNICKTKYIRGIDYVHLYRPDDDYEMDMAVEDVTGEEEFNVYSKSFSDADRERLRQLYEKLDWVDVIAIDIVPI